MTPLALRIRVMPGQPLALQTASHSVLQVWQGRLWITQSDDPNDYFLEAGERLALGSGRLVLEAELGAVAECSVSHGLQKASQKPAAPSSTRVLKLLGAG